jgi:RND family efflux transporter MFP subunit
MRQMSKVLTASLLVTVFGLAGCSQEAEQAEVSATQVVKANVQTVELGEVALMAVVPGAIVPEQKAQISSRLIGYIKGLEVKVGQTVKRGQLLFSIDSADIKSQIVQANAGYHQAVAGLNDATLDYDRFTQLYKDKSVSKQRFDKIRLQYSIAQQSVAAAKSALNQAKEQLNYANVKAPFAGVIVDKMAVAGDLASPGKPIVVIENTASLIVQTEVAGDLFAVLKMGDEATVLVEGQSGPLVGTVYTLVSSANPKTRTHTVKLSLPVINDVNSGTFARVSFKRGIRHTMMVPKSAVVNRAGIEGVFVNNNGKAFFRMVRTGLEIGDKVEIQAGLVLGEQIVVDNNQSILNGDKVEIIGQETQVEPEAVINDAVDTSVKGA